MTKPVASPVSALRYGDACGKNSKISACPAGSVCAGKPGRSYTCSSYFISSFDQHEKLVLGSVSEKQQDEQNTVQTSSCVP